MIRIVKLTFKEDKIEEIVSFLDSVKHIINGFEGCQGVQFLHDIHNPQIIMTYSIWDSENALNNYRHSEKFQMIWSTLKQQFSDKPLAWSLDAFFDGFEEHKH